MFHLITSPEHRLERATPGFANDLLPSRTSVPGTTVKCRMEEKIVSESQHSYSRWKLSPYKSGDGLDIPSIQNPKRILQKELKVSYNSSTLDCRKSHVLRFAMRQAFSQCEVRDAKAADDRFAPKPAWTIRSGVCSAASSVSQAATPAAGYSRWYLILSSHDLKARRFLVISGDSVGRKEGGRATRSPVRPPVRSFSRSQAAVTPSSQRETLMLILKEKTCLARRPAIESKGTV